MVVMGSMSSKDVKGRNFTVMHHFRKFCNTFSIIYLVRNPSNKGGIDRRHHNNGTPVNIFEITLYFPNKLSIESIVT